MEVVELHLNLFFIFCLFFISFICIRGFLSGVKRYQLNKSALKKIRKTETFKERMLYTKFKNEIPKSLRVLYFSILIVHGVGFIVCILLYFIDADISYKNGEKIVLGIVCYDGVWAGLLALLFWSPGKDFAYERWITKTRVKKKK